MRNIILQNFWLTLVNNINIARLVFFLLNLMFCFVFRFLFVCLFIFFFFFVILLLFFFFFFQIDNFILVHTKSSCRGVLNSVCHKILRIFTFDIATARMSDMDVPLYSGLIMSAYITSLNKPVPAIKSDQADFWIRYINQNGSKTDFVKRSVIKFGKKKNVDIILYWNLIV